MPPLHRVRKRRPSAVGERFQENAFTGSSVQPDPESQIVRDLTKRIDKLEGEVVALKQRMGGVEKRLDAIDARPAPEGVVSAVPPEVLKSVSDRLTVLEGRPPVTVPQGVPPEDVARVADACRLLDDQIAQLRAVLALMHDHTPRLQKIESALGVYAAAAASAISKPGGPR